MDPLLSGFTSVDSLIQSPSRPSRSLPVPAPGVSSGSGSDNSMPSVTTTPSGNTLQDIQSHLYNAFLSGDTADIRLQIRGDGWDLEYRFHRIVLIQAVSASQ